MTRGKRFGDIEPGDYFTYDGCVYKKVHINLHGGLIPGGERILPPDSLTHWKVGNDRMVLAFDSLIEATNWYEELVERRDKKTTSCAKMNRDA